uniref:Unc-51 like kinase 4 n=1 Tax=Oreochromis niloticus TaxID=8128 RepID=A0A669CUY2_ORENI
MENFILYEELGAGCNSVVYKGRRKGNLNYVAIKCTDKTKRPEITNHVRLTQDLDHPNIANFYEWYETSNHLWLVVELCTGGSLESVIALDGSLSQDGVRRFGWHLVKGLKHIHELGIIFSDLTPAKILLDGSGILKFGSFCLSKAEGETLQDFLTLFSASEEIEEGDSNQNTDNLKKRLQGSTAYSAPEVLEGSETNMNSDLWSLGCILYYMYTGKPPFCSDNYTELREMILNEEPPPPRQTGDKHFLAHQHHYIQTQTHTQRSQISYSTSIVNHTLLSILFSSCSCSSRANSVRNCSSSDCPNQNIAPQVTLTTSNCTDTTCCVKDLLHTEFDLTVTPVIDNPKILKNTPVRYDPKTLCVPAYSGEKLQSLSDEEWTVFLSQLCSSIEEQSHSTSTATRSKLNLLCYLCCVVGHTVIANRLINSRLVGKHIFVLRVMGLLALHCRDLGVDSPVSEAVSTLTDLLRDNLRNSKIKRLLLPPLAEFLYLISSQEKKRGSPEGLWFVPAAAYTGLMRSLREGDDTAVHHMAAKAIENISTVLSGPSHHLVTTEIGSALWYLFTHSTVEAVRVTAISSLSRLTRVVPAIFLSVIDTCGPVAILEGLVGTGARVQQHLLTAVAAALLTSCTQTHRVTQNRDLVLKVLRCLESPSTITRAKAILLLLLLIQDNTHTLLYCCQNRLVIYLERDLRKATPLRENPSQSGYLSQCLDLLIAYLSSTAPVIMEDVLCALRGVIGRRHPTTPQSKQLKQTLPTLSIVLDLVSSQVTWRLLVSTSIVNLQFLVPTKICKHGTHTQYSKHLLLIILSLPVFVCGAVEWSVFVLRVLSELSLILLVQDGVDTELKEERTEENKERSEKEGKAAEERGDGLSCITESLLSRYETLLRAPEPIPLHALKLLVSMTEHNGQAYIIFSTFLEYTGLIEVVVCTLSEAALAHLDREEHAGRKVGHVVLQALLELLHNVLKQTSVVVRSALQQLSAENQEIWEESIHCLSLLVQLYCGEGPDCLSPSCLRSFSHVLRTRMHTETPRTQRTALKIIKRLRGKKCWFSICLSLCSSVCPILSHSQNDLYYRPKLA